MKNLFNVIVLSALFAGCAVEPATLSTQSHEVSVVSLDLCPSAPTVLQEQVAHRYDSYPGAVYLAPAYPRPGDELFVVVAFPSYHLLDRSSARIHMTTDAWAAQQELEMERHCTERDEVFVASLGRYDAGSTVEFAVRVQDLYLGSDLWLNNHDQNYRFAVQSAPALAWLGDTHVRVAGQYIPSELVPADQPVGIYTQTYPMGAASQVELFVRLPGQADAQKFLMTIDMDFAGPQGSNSQWLATVPAELLPGGQQIDYWIRAEGENGEVIWDSRDGRNHQLNPQSYSVVWAGGFGAYRPASDGYQQGALFNADDSTSIGCWNHGASLSSYRERAVRVYVPGLTDRAYSDSEILKGAAAIIRVEAFANLGDAGEWIAIPARRFAKQIGNDFVYGFFPFIQFCNGGGFSSVADGSYQFKLRFSTDNGKTWFWRGSNNGPLGGENLTLNFAQRCSYFNDPTDCLP